MDRKKLLNKASKIIMKTRIYVRIHKYKIIKQRSKIIKTLKKQNKNRKFKKYSKLKLLDNIISQ